jgi:(2Fe-2S) ferredoxin
MGKIKYHMLVCGVTACHASKSEEILKNFQDLIKDKGLETEVQVIKTGCFGFCEKGPIVKMMPDNTFYTQVKPEDCAEILEEHIIKGEKLSACFTRIPKPENTEAIQSTWDFTRNRSGLH